VRGQLHAVAPHGDTLDRAQPLPEYPRPQMVRDSYLNLNGPWSYAITTSANKPAQADGTILVPFSPESELSGVGHVLQPEEYLWYIRTVTLPDGFNVGRVLLHFGAVDQTATAVAHHLRPGILRQGLRAVERIRPGCQHNVASFLPAARRQRICYLFYRIFPRLLSPGRGFFSALRTAAAKNPTNMHKMLQSFRKCWICQLFCRFVNI